MGGTGNGGGSGGGSGTNNFCRQFMVETTVLNNYSARLFEQMYIGSEQNGLTYQETKHWISDDGLPLKSEISEGFLSPRVETSRTINVYEYDPKITIEAPIK